ncbi:MAG: hypothetical protein OXC82_08680 [Rhodobacteraceae bacterium]|nr:hypothetical protein [Paracoccaceae bacterium]MCY4250489.1 hypothetical protein [Paracoccaceae bacterium]
MSCPFGLGQGVHCFVAASKTPDVMTRQLFHAWKKRQGILAASQSGRGHAIPGLRKAVLEISHPPSRNRRGLQENWIDGRN